MNLIPASYTEFLYWLKNQTENYWSQDPGTSQHEDKCPLWIYGAKWIGMTDEQIELTEQRYGIIFTPEHREFLKILHTIDRKKRVYEEYGSEEGAYYETPFMRNWLEDDDINSRINDVYKYISKDIEENKFWLNSWGARLHTADERIKVFNELYNKAPRLVPVMGHRYQVADLSLNTRPVLSILGTDIVYLGSDFRSYLLNELHDHLNIYVRKYDEEDQVWYWVINDEYKESFEIHDESKEPDIPFWKSFYLFDWTNHANNVHL